MAAAGQASGEEEEEEEEEEALPWEEQLEELPADLRQVLNRLSAGTLVLDARSLMEQVPHWAGLKPKPEVNNHRQDQHKKLDRVLRTLQQKVLSLMRVYPVLHHHIKDDQEEGEVLALGQQFWALLAQLEQTILVEKKKGSLPGSNGPEGPVLFSKEDLRQQAEQVQINKAGICPKKLSESFPSASVFPAASVSRKETSHFPTTTGYQGWKFRGGKGKGGRGGMWKPWRGAKGFKGWKGGKGKGPYPGASPASPVPTVDRGVASKQPVPQCRAANPSPDPEACRHSSDISAAPPFKFGTVDPPRGKRMGRNSPFPKIEAKSAFLGEKHFTHNGKRNKRGHDTPVIYPPKNVLGFEARETSGPSHKNSG